MQKLVERISYNLLFQRFVILSIENALWNHSVFSKNRGGYWSSTR